MTAVKVKDLRFTYKGGKKPALNGISLKIEKGEFFAILGPNGAGKTTLALCLIGVIPHYIEGEYDGEVVVNGLRILEHSIQEVATRLGLILQDPESQIIGITVKDDVAFGPCNLGLSRDEVLQRVKYSLGVVRLNGYEERETYRLSGGEKQRVAIASVLALKPDILVADEPTSELDPIGKREVFDTLLKLRNEEGKTIIMITHEVDWAVKCADRIGILYDGRFVSVGEPREVIRELGEEGLRRYGVRVPQASQLYFRLERYLDGNKSPWITVEEAFSALKELLGKKRGLKEIMARGRELVKSTGEPVIIVEDLWHIYPGGIEALRGINMHVYRGEHLAIIGQNGSGKTTLVKHFNGLLKPTKGRVLVFGIDTRNVSVSELSKKVGYVFQNPDHQIFAPSILEEVAFGLRNLKLPEEEVRKRVSWALNFVGLEGREEEHPFKLSKAERQMLAVASILSMKPDVIIVDEPTTGQDWMGVNKIMNMLDELKRMGHTIITITHDMRAVAEHADRVIVLQRGRILHEGSPREVFSKPEILMQTYLEPPPITLLAKSLSDSGVPVLKDVLTIEEAADSLGELLR
ncbi:MAG: hypothetical protein DRN60_03705 [Thaumarchaeota archaeon]|nr:MAG: hypothetical protein DRN60_03705 [Nitrososphaerota archaeon]